MNNHEKQCLININIFAYEHEGINVSGIYGQGQGLVEKEL